MGKLDSARAVALGLAVELMASSEPVIHAAAADEANATITVARIFEDYLEGDDHAAPVA